ncbi:MAG TPA: mechanosensitive ion channel family protein [Candidatus Limnocylindria bacterium]|nr:mechanosensitive ion channel family protein [Candidatus Limnocylindria bacterium]
MRRLLRTAVACSLLGLAVAAGAQDVVGPTLPPPAADDTSPVSPRSTVRGFLAAAREERWDAAAQYLNLANLPARSRASAGPDLARKLKAVFDRALVINLDTLSAAPEGNLADGQPEDRDLVGNIESREGTVKIYVERVRGDDQALEWRFSRPTVGKIDRLYEEFAHEPPFADRLPPAFFTVRVFDTALWQWIGLVLVALAGLVSAVVVSAIVLGIARPITRRTRGDIDNAVVEMLVGPLRLVLAVIVVRALLPSLWLPLSVHGVCTGFTAGLVVVAATWFLVRMVTLFSRVAQLRLAAQGSAVGISAIPLVRRMVNAVVVLVAILLVLTNLGLNMTGVLAGLGVGGLAVALAAQKSLENLFGGVTLIFDQPVHVGDVCRFGDRVGTVEDIGLRSTRIRTPERTLVTIPNAEFSSLQIENFARRDRILATTTIGLRYDTSPDQLRYLLVQLRRLLLSHPKIDPDTARARFVGFSLHSLDVEIYAYVRTTDFNEYLAIREEIYLRVVELVLATGTDFALQQRGIDPERARAAEAAVRQWRESGELPPSAMPADRAAALDNALDYPPVGSPAGGRR